MSMSLRTRKITAVLATAVIVPAAAIGVTSATTGYAMAEMGV